MRPKIIQLMLPLLVVIAGALYARSGSHVRIPEDEAVVWSNPAITEDGISGAVEGRFYDSSTDGFRPAVRPVSTLILRAAWGSFRGDRAGFQWLQIALLGIGALLLGLLWMRQSGSGFSALIAGLWLAVHPIAASSVLTMAGIGYLLALSFLLAAFLAACRVFDAWRRGERALDGMVAISIPLLLLLALGSCETALAGVAVLGVWAWAEHRRLRDVSTARARESGDRSGPHPWGSEAVRFALILAIPLILALVYRVVSLSLIPPNLGEAHATGAATGLEFSRRLAVGLAAVPTILRLMIVPIHLGYSYDYLLTMPHLGLRAALGAGLLLAVVALLVAAVRGGWRSTLWIALFFFPTLGALGILAPLTDFDTERLALLALPGWIGMVLSGALLLQDRVPGIVWKRAALAAATLVACLFAYRTLSRVEDFHDWTALVKAQTTTYPESAQGRLDQGNLYLSRRLWSGAVTEFEQALRLRPDFWVAWVNLGTAHIGQEEPGLAMRSLDEAIAGVKERPEFAVVDARAQYNRALVLMQQDRNSEAVTGFQRMLQVFPDHVSSHANLGFIFSNNRQYDAQARLHLGRALELEKDPERAKVLEDFLTRIEKRRQRAATDQDAPPPTQDSEGE